VLAAVHGISVFLAEIGCTVVLAGWVAGQSTRESPSLSSCFKEDESPLVGLLQVEAA